MAYGLTQSAVSVNASNTGASAANSTSLRTPGGSSTPLSYETWFKTPASLPSTGFQWTLGGLYHTSGATNANVSWEMFITFVNSTTWNINWYLSNGSTAAQPAAANWTPTPSTWYHIAFAYNQNGGSPTLKLFINGVQFGSTITTPLVTTLNQPSTATGFYVFGGGTQGSDSPNGNVSLARLWSNDQSANFATNMCQVLGTASGLQAEWTLNNTLADNTGNGNTLTNLNSFTYATDVPSTCIVATVNSGFFFAVDR